MRGFKFIALKCLSNGSSSKAPERDSLKTKYLLKTIRVIIRKKTVNINSFLENLSDKKLFQLRKKCLNDNCIEWG